MTAFEEANALYRDGKYAEAAAAYQKLLAQSKPSAALHYNLGNAYFKTGASGDLGRAVAEYWRAYRLDPRDSDIRANLDFALKRSGESLVPAGIPPVLHAAFHWFGEGELLGLQWIGLWAALLLAAASLAWPARMSRRRPILIGAAAFWAAVAAWWGLRRAAQVQGPGVVLEDRVEARSGPGANFPVSFDAPEGRRVSILSESGDWLEVGVLKEGLKGWVPAKAVERI